VKNILGAGRDEPVYRAPLRDVELRQRLVEVRHELNSSRALWMSQSNSWRNNSVDVFAQTKVTLL